MVELGSRSNLLVFAVKDVIFGILVGFMNSCFGVQTVLFNIGKSHVSKDAHDDLRDSSASVSEKKSRSRKKNNDAYNDVTQCVKFNGFLFCAAFGVFWFISFLTNFFWNPDESSWMYSVSNVGVQSVILIPTYIISKLSNLFWLQELSNKAYCKRYGSPSTFSMAHIGNLIADVTFSLILECLLVVQAIILEYLLPPWIAHISGVVHYSLLNALYSFEYLWCNKGWSLHKRISYLEANWPYFMGFGLPLTTVTYLIPLNFFFCGLVFSICYPFFIVAAINSPPLTIEQRGPSLRVFRVIIWLTSNVSKGVTKVWRWWRGYQPR